MQWFHGFAWALWISYSWAFGPQVDPVSCSKIPFPEANSIPELTPDMVEDMLREAFEMAENAAKLADTPDDFWDHRVNDVFTWMLNDNQLSEKGRLAKGRHLSPHFGKSLADRYQGFFNNVVSLRTTVTNIVITCHDDFVQLVNGPDGPYYKNTLNGDKYTKKYGDYAKCDSHQHVWDYVLDYHLIVICNPVWQTVASKGGLTYVAARYANHTGRRIRDVEAGTTLLLHELFHAATVEYDTLGKPTGFKGKYGLPWLTTTCLSGDSE